MYFYFRLFFFLVGVLLGVYLAWIVHDVDKHEVPVTRRSLFNSGAYKKWFESQGLVHKKLHFDQLNYGDKNYNLESDFLFKKVPVLCVILVKSEKNLKAAKDTWAKGCNGIEVVYLVDKAKPSLPVKRNKDKSSWVLLCNVLLQIKPKYDWVMVVHDVSFVIMENLRFYVAPLDAKQGYYLGHTTTFWGHNYNSGQAGYVISRGSLQLLKSKLNNSESCTKDLTYWNREDFYLGKHLASLNVHPVDTRDEFGLSTFHPYNWYHVFFPGENYYQYSKFPHNCCSKHSISFQAIEGDKMYTYNYLFYTLQLFISGNQGNKPPVKLFKDEEVWKKFLKERNIPDDISSQQYYKVWEDLIEDPNSFAQNMKREQHSDL